MTSELPRTISRCLLVCCLLAPFAMAGCGGGATADVTVTFKEVEAAADDGGDTETTPVTVGKSGSVKGRITVSGASPLPPLVAKGDVKTGKDEICAARDVPDERLVVGANGGLKNVFIYLDKVPSKVKKLIPKAELTDIKVDQQYCRFVPHAVLCRTGQKVVLLNSDSAAHNVNSKSKKNTPFSSVVKAEDKTGSQAVVYKKAEKEPFRVVCDFHSWMVGYHLPLDHPWAAVSGDDGSFEIKDLPPGKYTFKVWHEGRTLERVKVTINPGEAFDLTRSYDAATLLGS